MCTCKSSVRGTGSKPAFLHKYQKEIAMTYKAKLSALFACFLSAAVLLSGCAQTPQPETDTTAAPSESSEGTPINHITYQDYLSNRACTPEGMYSVQYIYPASQNLFYLDAESGQQLFLCAVPNCRHDSEACSSYLPLRDAANGYSLCYHNDALFLIQCSSGEDLRPHISKMKPDGSELQELCVLEDGENFTGKLFGYGDSLLTEIYSVTPEGQTTKQLEKINCDTGSRETVVTCPDGGRYTLMGAAGSRLIYLYMGDQGYRYFWVDPAQSEISLETCAEETPLTEVFQDEVLHYSIQGDYLCKVDREQEELAATNLLTGEVYSFEYPAADPNISWVGLKYLFDDHFALTYDQKNGDTVCNVTTILDTATGKPTDVSYSEARDQMRQVIAVYGDRVLYFDHDEEVPLRNQTEYGLVNESTYISVYKMAGKEDFLQGLDGEVVADPFA